MAIRGPFRRVTKVTAEALTLECGHSAPARYRSGVQRIFASVVRCPECPTNAKLPSDRSRQAWTLKTARGYSLGEIARELDISRERARQLVNRYAVYLKGGQYEAPQDQPGDGRGTARRHLHINLGK